MASNQNQDETIEGQGTTEAAKLKASETAESYTKESAVAGKAETGGVLQQAAEMVKGAVVGAKDAAASMLGMGGDNTTNAGKDTTAENTTRDLPMM